MIYYRVHIFLNTKYKNICLKNDIGVHIFFLNKVIFHVLRQTPATFFCTCSLYMIMSRVAQEIMKITKSFAMEVKKSVFIPNNNKQDGNKT